MNKKIAIGGT